MDSNKSVSYFEPPYLLWYLLVPGVFYTWSIGFLAYFPHLNPYESLGNIGIFSKYLFTQHRALSITILWLTLAIHVTEVIYALRLAKLLCLDKQSRVKWAFNTFLIGFLSLRVLIKYERNNRKSI